MTDETQDQEPADIFTPRDGLPGPREILNRTNTALATLQTRGLAIQPDPEVVGMQIAGVLKLLFEKGLATEPEFQTAAQAARRGGLASADPERHNADIAGILRLVFDKGLATEAEFAYYAQLARMEGLEGIVIQTTPRARIYRPGAN